MNDRTKLVAQWDVVRGTDGRTRPVMRWVALDALAAPAPVRVAVPAAA